MRTFVGIDLDETTRGDLVALGESVRAAAPAWQGEKWVPANNLHLTLRFLGDLDTSSVDELVRALEEDSRTQRAFTLTCAVPVEPVPGPSRARMLWTRYEDPDGACSALARAVDDVVAGFGFAPEGRPFVPHVTLVRSRRPRTFSPSDAWDSQLVPTLSVPAVTVFSSLLTRSAPRYERIARIELARR